MTGAVSALGGTVTASAGDLTAATVPTSALTRLATSRGVTGVTQPVKAYTDAISQGVAASGASVWQSTGTDGTGVTVAIVDAGFANLASEIANHNLPAGTSVVGNHCGDVNGTDHGTAVSEIVHQMAPGATLKLYCIDDTVGFSAAETQIEAAGDIKIVNSSVSFPGDDRGDGTGGGASSAATAIQRARQSGILWIQSAGNAGVDHWSGNFIYDAATQLTRLDADNDELDYVTVGKNQSAAFFLQWDDWPTSNLDISLAVAPSDASGSPSGAFQFQTSTPGTAPTLSQCFAPGGTDGCIDTSAFPNGGQLYAVGIRVPQDVPSVRYDLDYEGYVSPNSLSCTAVNFTTHTCTTYTATPGSVSQPASSPYALAVGAADVKTDNSNTCGGDVAGSGTYPLENYSGRGPTIDGRTKPDLVAFDGVAGNLGSSPFCGTSAAAPHVAGAAALVAQLHPELDADGLQNFLTQRANFGSPITPANNNSGSGVLALGVSTGGALVPLSPFRILDTRAGTGAPKAAVGAFQTATLPVAGVGSIPSAGVAAVVLNVTVASPTSGGFITVWGDGSAPPLASNLNFSPGQTVPNLVIAPVGSDGKVRFYNGSPGTVQLVADASGYYLAGPPGGGGLDPFAPVRVLDTRDGVGAPAAPVGAHQSVALTVAGIASVPATGVSAVVLNVTVASPTSGGFITVWGDGSSPPLASNLNFSPGQTVPNLVVAPVSSDGKVHFYNGSGGTVHLIADAYGYFEGGPPAGGGLVSNTPSRLLDTRDGTGLVSYQPPAAVGAFQSVTLTVDGVDSVPAAGVSAVVLNVTVASPTSGGFITVWGDGSSPPLASNLNFSPGQTVPNLVIVPVSADGTVHFYNGSPGPSQLIADIFGYVLG